MQFQENTTHEISTLFAQLKALTEIANKTHPWFTTVQTNPPPATNSSTNRVFIIAAPVRASLGAHLVHKYNKLGTQMYAFTGEILNFVKGKSMTYQTRVTSGKSGKFLLGGARSICAASGLSMVWF